MRVTSKHPYPEPVEGLARLVERRRGQGESGRALPVRCQPLGHRRVDPGLRGDEFDHLLSEMNPARRERPSGHRVDTHDLGLHAGCGLPPARRHRQILHPQRQMVDERRTGLLIGGPALGLGEPNLQPVELDDDPAHACGVGELTGRKGFGSIGEAVDDQIDGGNAGTLGATTREHHGRFPGREADSRPLASR